MSDGLRQAFPQAHFIPFNPLWLQKLEKAKTNVDIDMIIVDSSVPDWSVALASGLVRENWIVKNTVLPVLDVGCEKGVAFKNTGFDKWSGWFGFDLDVWQVPNFVQGDIHKLPYKPKSFRSVTVTEVLQHIENPIVALMNCIRTASERVIITVGAEHVWSKQIAPFITVQEKNKLDCITLRQQIDKHTRWETGCLNPKTVAKWDEENYPHLWQQRYFYVPEDVDKIPSGRTEKPEVDFLSFLDEATKEYDKKYSPEVSVNANWHFEKLSFFPWVFLGAVICVDGSPFITNYEFKKYFEDGNGWYGQIFSGEKTNLVGFLRRI